MNSASTSRGFTLIELMIAVAIVGLLAAVAYPTYQDTVRKSRRSDGMSALMECATSQERYYTRNNSYADQAAADSSDFCQDSSEGYYAVSVANSGCTFTVNGVDRYSCFTATATAQPKGGQDNDTECYRLIVDETGSKRSEDSGGNATTGCWAD